MIGACLRSLFEYKGSRVTGLSHVGDFGSPLGSVVAEILEEGEERFPFLKFLKKGEEGMQRGRREERGRRAGGRNEGGWQWT
jgi:hypothetical protein